MDGILRVITLAAAGQNRHTGLHFALSDISCFKVSGVNSGILYLISTD